MQKIVTRREARKTGLLKYFTGKPCKRGHPGWRYTKTRGCVHCNTLYKSGFRDKLIGKIVVSVYVHPADKQLILDFAHALNTVRGFRSC